MFIKNINLVNFRNFSKNSIIFGNINIIIGNNAQGKSNLLEAIYILSTLRSFRKNNDNELIRFSNNNYYISAEYDDNKSIKKICIEYNIDGNKTIKDSNNEYIKKIDHIGIIKSTILIPEDINIISGDSLSRKKFIDVTISQTDRVYLKYLLEYNKILKQRNHLLRLIKDGKQKVLEIEPWNDQLIKFSSLIYYKRYDFISKIKEIVSKTYNYLSNRNEEMNIVYSDSIMSGKESSLEEYELSFKNRQKRVLSEEIIRGHTILGIHRDDIDITINGKEAKIYGSLGQQRSIAISLRMSGHEYMYSLNKEYPILLIDDIFSELDPVRREKLLELLTPPTQLFITGTKKEDFEPLLSNAQVFSIQNGNICNA
jgi:DNA replication and repair protein RecF